MIKLAIRPILERKGMTQQQLSNLTGIDHAHVSRLVRFSPRRLDVGTLDRISKALGVSPFELLKDDEV